MKEQKQAILDAFWFRHACKQFDSERRISDEDFEFILETGRLSPSSFGFEPWQFVVLQDKGLREKLLPYTWGAQKILPTASHIVLLLAKTTNELLPASGHIQHMMLDIQGLPEHIVEAKTNVYQTFLESDFKLLSHERLPFEWASRQTYIALGNMMTAAAMIGIDSCPVEGFQEEPVDQLLREAGIVSDGHALCCMVGFGYRVKEPRPKTRRPMNEVVRWV